MGLLNAYVAAVLIAGVAGIAVLCWVWMSASRASQARQEERQQQLIRLIEEQNTLLQRFLDGQPHSPTKPKD